MSEHFHPLKWALKFDIKQSAKMVLIAMIDHIPVQNGKPTKDECWPSLDELCRLSSAGRTTVIEAIRILVEAKIITVEKKYAGGKRKNNVYKINFCVNPDQHNEQIIDNICPDFNQFSDQKTDKKDTVSPESVLTESESTEFESTESVQPKSGIRTYPLYTNYQMNYQESMSDPPSDPADQTPSREKCRFEEFWVAYPRHECKKIAREVWKRKKLDRIADEIIADLEKRKVMHAQWQEGFIPHAKTYLRNERWQDEIVSKKQNSNANAKNWGHDNLSQDDELRKAVEQAKKQTVLGSKNNARR